MNKIGTMGLQRKDNGNVTFRIEIDDGDLNTNFGTFILNKNELSAYMHVSIIIIRYQW